MFGGKLGVAEAVILCLSLGFMLIPWFPWYKIFSKAGYRNSGLLAVVMLIPVVDILLLFWFAFTTWPIEQKPERALSSSSGS